MTMIQPGNRKQLVMACVSTAFDAYRVLPRLVAVLALGVASLVVACGPTDTVSSTTTERVTTQQPAQVPPSTTVTTTRTQRSSP